MFQSIFNQFQPTVSGLKFANVRINWEILMDMVISHEDNLQINRQWK